MAQLTIYLDDETIRKIEKAAAQEKRSISSWVKGRLVQSLSTEWPAGYNNYFGSLKDDDLNEEAEPSFDLDAKREKL